MYCFYEYEKSTRISHMCGHDKIFQAKAQQQLTRKRANEEESRNRKIR